MEKVMEDVIEKKIEEVTIHSLKELSTLIEELPEGTVLSVDIKVVTEDA